MIKSFQYLEIKLKELHKLFPKCNIRYEYRETRKSHIIEITPLSFYEDEDYQIAETDIEDDFEIKYPGEDIVFVSENSLTKVTNPCLELIAEQNLTWCVMLHQEDQYAMDMFGIDLEFAGENNYAIAA